MTQHISTPRSEAARRNGAKSRGPKTEEGKLRSSQNSVKHGMYARSIVLPGESQEEYDQLRDQYLAEFTPTGPAEHHEVETMLNAEWRIRRFRYMETAAIAEQMPNHREYPHDAQVAVSYNWSEGTVKNVYQFEPRLQRDYDRALRRLLDLQKKRKNEPKPELTTNHQPLTTASGLTTDHCPLTTVSELTTNHQSLTTASELTTDHCPLTTSPCANSPYPTPQNPTVVFHPAPLSDIHLLNPSKPLPDPLA